MTDSQAACAAAKFVKRGGIGKAIIGALLAMPTATVLLNKLKGYDPKKALRAPAEPAPLSPEAYKLLAVRLAAQQMRLGLGRPNPLLESARGLRAYRGAT